MIDSSAISKIVEETVAEYLRGGKIDGMASSQPQVHISNGSGSVSEVVARAKKAQEDFIGMKILDRSRVIDALRAAALTNARSLAEDASRETGYGRVSDKELKNKLAANNTPGVEDLDTRAISGDDGLTLFELAPFGVIGSITPSTNPVATLVNNSISMLAAGNAVVFNPHPAAKECSRKTIDILDKAIVSAGAPQGLIGMPEEISQESGNELMNHKDIALLSVTGGEAIVHIAMRTGKKVIAAGPGNPPVIVDDTADIVQAAADIINGASFDNNVMCLSEKEVFVLDSVARRLMEEMCSNGAVMLDAGDTERLAKKIILQSQDNYAIDRQYIGKNAKALLDAAGIACSHPDPKMIICETGPHHPFVVTEMMTPVLAIVRVKGIDEAIGCAIAAEMGYRHTATMHSTNIRRLSRAAKELNTTIFVKNAPSYAGNGFGGEGFTSLTIATPTGEGLTSARTFTRIRRCVLRGDFRIV